MTWKCCSFPPLVSVKTFFFLQNTAVLFCFFYKLTCFHYAYCLFPISACTISTSVETHQMRQLSSRCRVSAQTLVSETSQVENLAHKNPFASAHQLISCTYFMLTPWKHSLSRAAQTLKNMNASFLFRRGSCFSCVLVSYWEKVAGNNKRCCNWNNFTDQNVAVRHQQLMKASPDLITGF